MKRNTVFFFWILVLATGLLISITIARLITQGFIDRLGRGNNQAAVAMTMNNRLQEMVNLSFELETKMLRDRPENLVMPQRGIKDSLARLEYNMGVLKQLCTDTVQQATLAKLTDYINRQVNASFEQLHAAGTHNDAQFRLLSDSMRSSHWGDSIYATALFFQKETEKDLNATLRRNNDAAAQLSSLNRLLVFVSLFSILVLVTIIIRRQVKQLALIKDLEKAKKAALQSVEAKDQFLANMSHEIRTPLNAIRGFGRILQQTPLDRDQQKYAAIISTASENLLSIVNDILDFSKIATGNLVLKRKEFELAAVLQEAELMFMPLAQEKNLELKVLPDPSLPAFVKSDPERLRQILVNLLSNAIKFTARGSVKLTADPVDEKGKRIKIRFTVTDTGVGIPAEKQQLVFERFEQLDDSFSRQQGGTGLGLAITRHLVDAMGGTIALKSEVGKGSAFIVELEFETISRAGQQVLKPAAAGDTSTRQLRARVLVAEDNQMNQLLVKSMLERYHIITDLAVNGIEAVQAVREKQYDLVLMDVQMPGMDGLTATRIIRGEIDNITPVIAMTAHVLPGEREKCMAAGMNDYLPKPLDEQALDSILRKFIAVTEKPAAPDIPECKIPWLNIQYLSSICNHEPGKLAMIIQALREQLPLEKERLRQVMAAGKPEGLRDYCHYMRSTLSGLQPGAPPLVLLDELGKMFKLGVPQELLWRKAGELAALLGILIANIEKNQQLQNSRDKQPEAKGAPHYENE